MKLKFIFLGKKDLSSLSILIDKYLKRLNTYVKSELLFFPEKNSKKLDQKISKHITRKSHLIILDEHGMSPDTLKYAKFIQNKMIHCDSLIFIVGSAYGVPAQLLNRENSIISLSSMTLPHLIARLILVEQTYRAFSILNNHPYHHE